MLRLSSNIYSNIFFGDEVDNLDITGLHTILSAPTAFTGQRLSGSLLVCHYGIQEHVFDSVQCILRGMSEELIVQLLTELKFSRGSEKWSQDDRQYRQIYQAAGGKRISIIYQIDWVEQVLTLSCKAYSDVMY